MSFTSTWVEANYETIAIHRVEASNVYYKYLRSTVDYISFKIVTTPPPLHGQRKHAQITLKDECPYFGATLKVSKDELIIRHFQASDGEKCVLRM